MDEIRLKRDISSYSPSTLKGQFTRARNLGVPLYSSTGSLLYKPKAKESPTKTVDQDANNASGKERDNNKIAQALNLMGLTRLAPSLEHGNIGGNAGFFGMQKPYITITLKKPIGTEDLNKYIGLPLEAKKSLSTLTGYTEVSHLFIPSSLGGTLLQDEEQEIRDLLSSGVIL